VNKNWPNDLKFGCNASKNMANVFELEAKWAKELEIQIEFECEEVYDAHD
jgi:hypothetical protein